MNMSGRAGPYAAACFHGRVLHARHGAVDHTVATRTSTSATVACVVVAVVMLAAGAQGELAPNEVRALMDIYYTNGGENWSPIYTLYGWVNGTDPCEATWAGVLCGGRGADGYQHVDQLLLPLAGLTGTLPESIGEFTHMHTLSVLNNDLTGPLPRSLYKLRSLTSMTVVSNMLTGDVPSLCVAPGGLPPQLSVLDLHDMNLTGWDTRTDCGPSANFTRALAAIDVHGNNITAKMNVDFISNAIGATNVASLNAAGNAGLVIQLNDFYNPVLSVASLNLANTATYGDFTLFGETSQVQQVIITNTRVVGALPDTVWHLSYVDIRGTGMRAVDASADDDSGGLVDDDSGGLVGDDSGGWVDDDLGNDWNSGVDDFLNDDSNDDLPPPNALPAYLQLGPGQTLEGNSSCLTAQPTPGYSTVVLMDPSYLDYASCSCLAGFHGTGIDCQPCSPGRWSDAGWADCQPCTAGTAQPLGSSRAGPTTCVPCAFGNFSLPGATECFTCPSVGVRCNAGTLNVDEGYWWFGDLAMDGSLELFKCLGDGSMCLEVNSAQMGMRAQCGAGVAEAAPLCAVCEDGYALSSGGSCSQCPSFVAIVISSAAAVVLTMVCATSAIVRNAIAHHAAAKPLGLVGRTGVDEFEERQKRAAAGGDRGALRTLITFLQLTSLNGDFRLHYTHLLHLVLHTASSVGGDGASHVLSTPLQCAARAKYTMVVFASACMPFVCIIVAVMIAAGSRMVCRRQLKALPFWHDVATGSTTLMFLLYTRTATVAFAAFKPYPRSINGTTYLEADFRVTTEDEQYTAMQIAAVVMLMMSTFGAPAVAFVHLKKWQAQRQRPRRRTLSAPLINGSTEMARPVERQGFVQSPAAMLMRGYRNEAWWWEATVAVRKLAFSAMTVFLTDTAVQSAAVIVLLTCLLVLHLQYRPFKEDRLNNAETLALFSLIVTRTIATSYRATETYGELWDYSITALLLLLNGATAVILLWLYIGEAPWKKTIKCWRYMRYWCCPAEQRRLRREGGRLWSSAVVKESSQQLTAAESRLDDPRLRKDSHIDLVPMSSAVHAEGDEAKGDGSDTASH